MKIEFKTERLYVTEFDESMAESVHINSLDGDNRIFIPDEVFETVDKARETITLLMSFYPKNDAPQVYPLFLNDGQHIGHVQAYPVSSGWEIGYHVAKPFTGKGFATEAVSAFLPFIMCRLGINHIRGICHAENVASRKVMEKCGFSLEFEGIGTLHGTEQPVCRYIFETGGSCNKNIK